MVPSLIANRGFGYTDGTYRDLQVPGTWTNNRYFYYDRAPFGAWEARAILFYLKERYNENTMANVGALARATPPAYPPAWTVATPWAVWDEWSTDLGLTYSRSRFRIKNKNGITNGEPVQVFVYFDPEDQPLPGVLAHVVE